MNKMVSQIPIFITVRGYDKEIVNKHKEALKYAYLFIKEQDLFSQTYIISDNKNDILEYAKKLGFINIIHYPCGSKKDLKYLEYLATYRYGVENNYHPDWIILLNINQAFQCIFDIGFYDFLLFFSITAPYYHIIYEYTKNCRLSDMLKRQYNIGSYQ